MFHTKKKQPDDVDGNGHLPEYDQLLVAYHQAFRKELGQAIRDLPLKKNARVLDVPCGDGFYSRLLAQAAPEGHVVGADLRESYLVRNVTRARGDHEGRRAVVQSDVYNMPFSDREFDLVWCAQSLISLDDPLAALREMRRVARPDGFVVVLENDAFHQVLLPWPIDLELAVHQAQRADSQARFGTDLKVAPARRTRGLFLQAGINPIVKRTYAADRQYPYSPSVRKFLTLHLRSLRDQLEHRLPRSTLRRLERFCDPRSPESLLQMRAGDFTCLNVLFVGAVR